MSKEGSKLHPAGRAILAIIALVVIVISGNMLVASLGIGHKTLDLTEDRIHTLSDGTKNILEELAAPVEIRYYASRGSRYMSEEVKLQMQRLDDLLAEYENLSGDKLRIEDLNPEPDTDAEDSANLDGLTGASFDGENLYFGLAVSCLDRIVTIPLLSPQTGRLAMDETMLEYEISRAIAEVSATRKPVIGLMSALDLAGGPAGMPGQRPPQPWVIYNQLQQAYEVDDLTMTPGEIDPDKYKLVLLIHPAEITPEAEFAIDQYLLKGGTVVACVDPFSVAAQMTGGGNPMMGMPGAPTSSSLPTLMKAWGVEMATNQVVGDGRYQTVMNGNRPGLAVLTVPQEGMPQEDSIITKDLTSVTLFLPGGMTKTGGAGISIDTLVKASPEAGLVDNMPASRLDPSLVTTFRPDGKTYDLVLHLHGSFKTAFPDGDPAAKTEEAAGEAEEEQDGDAAPAEAADTTPATEATDGDANEEEAAPEEPKATSLTKAEKNGNVFLISDVDAFYDNFAYQVQRLGNIQLAQPINGNSSLLFNVIDQAASSTHLIGSRSRAATSRPFTVFREMEADANQKVGAKIQEFQDEANEAQQRLNELQSQKTRGTELYLTPEQEQEIKKLRSQEVDARKQIRELEKGLRREKDAIAARIITYNIAGVPLVIILVGLGLFATRRARTRAR
ncbi:gliding motility ABC transporter [Haloferula helveola]|uniref:Gliding motility ABC transporter n=1 Tax=Haloferula helveola TaxID=490095 RepID=A0ABN6H6U6_9BACT|nr:gliding motility ABC transporter [Haloferula helveola]